MAFQMSYSQIVPFQTTPLVYPDAYWVASIKDLNKVTATATVVFEAYADKATRTVGKAKPIASHGFTVTGNAFNIYFGTNPLTTSNIYAQAYAMAKVTPDPLPANVRPAKLTSPPTPAPVGTIFFANAVEV